ncbi:putative glutamine transport system permease protein [Streptococcus pneumoniae]|nr:putative glutamine transport system permease protein [Streptococcus pneumoniae]
MQDSGIQVLFQGNNLLRILQGLGVTIGISILSVLLSMMFGTVMGIIMTSHSRIIRFLTRLYLEFIRIMPQLVLLFIVYFGLARNFNINISGETSAIIVFTLWGTAEMGDLVRGAITSLPKHQFESGQALGLTNVQLYYHIIIPQVLRRLLPQAINLVTRMIKTTSFPNHSYLSQLDVTYKTPDLMSHFLPPHEVSFTFCCFVFFSTLIP